MNMDEINNINIKNVDELLNAFNEIQMPRSSYALKNFVVNSKFTEEQRYAQCVLELQVAYDNLRLADLHLKEKNIEIDEIVGNDEKSKIKRQIKEIEQEQTKRAVLGAMREFKTLYEIWNSFSKKYNREDIEAAQEKEYTLRLSTQAKHDMLATGKISVGNQEGLRQLGYSDLNALPIYNKLALDNKNNNKVLVSIITKEKATNGIKCLENLKYPNNFSFKIFNVWGRSELDSYLTIIEEAKNDNVDYIVLFNENLIIPSNFLNILNDININNQVITGNYLNIDINKIKPYCIIIPSKLLIKYNSFELKRLMDEDNNGWLSNIIKSSNYLLNINFNNLCKF